MAQKMDVNTFVRDYCDGVKDKDLLTKHGLSVKQMIGVVKKLIKEGRITKDQYFDRNRKIKEREVEEEKKFLSSLYHCPVCGHIHPTPFISCPACGTDVTKQAEAEEAPVPSPEEAEESPAEEPAVEAGRVAELQEAEEEFLDTFEKVEEEAPPKRPSLRAVSRVETAERIPENLSRLIGAGLEDVTVTADGVDSESIGRYLIAEAASHVEAVTSFRADDPDGEGPPLSVKVYHIPGLAEEDHERLLQELAVIQSNMADPNIITSMGTASADGVRVLLAEYLPFSADMLIEEEPEGLPAELLQRIVPQILNGLGYSHLHRGKDGVIRKVPHLMLTPSKLLVDEDKHIVKIDECGLVRALLDLRGYPDHLSNEPLIDPAYLAPEAFVIRSRAVNPVLADIYTLGVTLYVLVTGQLPFQCEDVEEFKFAHLRKFPVPPKVHRYTVAPWLDSMILKCLEKDPNERWRSATQMELSLGKSFTA